MALQFLMEIKKFMENLEIGSHLDYVGMHFQDENTCGFFHICLRVLSR